MRKFSNILKMLALVPASIAIGSLPAMADDTEPWVMNLTENYVDLPDCNFTGTDENGNVFGFRISEEYNYDTWNYETRVKAIGVIAEDSQPVSLTFPDQINYTYNGQQFTKPLKIVELRHGWNGDSFPGMDNLTDIYLPSSIEKTYSYGKKENGKLNLHFTSENVPYIFFAENSVSYVNIVVDEALVETYDQAVEGKYFVLAENAQPQDLFIISESGYNSTLGYYYSGVAEDGITYQFMVEGEHSGIYDDQNNYFSGYTNYRNIRFIGIEVSEENKDLTSITVPEKVTLVSSLQKCTVSTEGFYFYMDENFSGLGNVSDIYLPSTVTNLFAVGGYINRPLNLHLASENTPEIYLCQNPAVWFNLFVAQDKYADYEAALEGRYFLFAEGAGNEYPGMILKPADESFLPGCNYIGYDEKGNMYGFNVNCEQDYHGNYWASTNPYSVYFVGMVPAQNASNINSITIPVDFKIACGDGLKYENPGVLGVNFHFEYDGVKSFPGMDGLKDIYFPSTVNDVTVSGRDLFDYVNLHLTSDIVPNLHFYNEADQWMILTVADDMFMAYDDVIKNTDLILRSETPAEPTRLDVKNPGTLADQIYETLTDLNGVRWLILTGNPNSDDLLLIRRMYRLEKLDLSALEITSLEKCNDLRYLYSISLPETLTELGEEAFSHLISLTSITLPESLSVIGQRAFYNCTRLLNVNLPKNVKRIDNDAFHNTKVGADWDLSNVEYFGSSAFSNCHNLTRIDISNASTLGAYAFQGCINLEKVNLGSKLQTISHRSFEVTALKEIIIPDGVYNIEERAFGDCYNLKKITLGKDIKSINDDYYDTNYYWKAFNNVRPDTIISNILFPINGNGFDDRDAMLNTTLYVPRLTLNNYLLHDKWTNFANIEPLPEGDLTEIDITQPFELITNYGVANQANIINESEFTVNREYPVNLATYTTTGNLYYNGWWDEWGYSTSLNVSATLVAKSQITADNVVLKLQLPTNRWNFLSFPFDVKVGEIVVDNTDNQTLWVVRKYSGDDRAKLTENTWQNMTDDMTLRAGEGYIFHCTKVNNDNGWVDFTFTAASNGNNMFNTKEAVTELAQYPSEFPHNDSWNLVGNKYPAYVNIKGIDFEAPITVWSGDNYYAYSPLDDDYILAPYEAFFVQRQEWEGGDKLTIKPEARATNRSAASEWEPIQTRAYVAAPKRTIFNLTIKGEGGADRARLVINENAKLAYESNRDAAKFMSTVETVPQLYVMNNDVKLSIDERPFGNGEVQLGAYFGAKGQYTIALNLRGEGVTSAMLLDKLSGKTIDILAAPYTFDSEAGTFNERFVLNLNMSGSIGGSDDTTGIEKVENAEFNISLNGNVLNVVAPENENILVVATDGKVIASANGNVSVELQNGIYIVKAGDKTRKVVVGK